MTMRLTVVAAGLGLAILGVTSRAAADPSTGGSPPEPPASGPTIVYVQAPSDEDAYAASHPQVPRGIIEDANSGQVWLMPTALSQPAGTWSITDTELLGLGASVALSDNVSIAGTTLLPVGQSFFVGLASLKAEIIRDGAFHLALQGSFSYVSGDNGFSVGGLGGVATYCTSDDCASHLSFYTAGAFALADSSSVPILFSGGWVQKLSKHVKLVLEVDSAILVGDINEVANGAVLWYGIRVTSTYFGVDVGFARPVYRDYDAGNLPMGAPWVAVQYRGLR
jgi:hypothetical protein